ncbi:MAG: OmpA family protein [Terriglobales bacterium]
MHVSHRFVILVLLLSAVTMLAQKPMADKPGAKDPVLFTRMPHYFLSSGNAVVETQFDYYEFRVTQGKTVTRERIEGRKTVYDYSFDRSAGTPPSGLQIARNYQDAIKRLGGEVLYDGPSLKATYDPTTLRIKKDGKEIWAEVLTRGGSYYVTIVERKAMQQNVIANAQAFKDGLTQNGHVEVPGIFFDFNKSDIKPESEPALAELVKLLDTDKTLKVWVVGHTDNIGSADTNVTLSNARAQAVVKALLQKSIAPTRLSAKGLGPFAPVASNATDEGRAKNRRVELVAQP